MALTVVEQGGSLDVDAHLCMCLPDTTIFADTYSELVGYLLEGYPTAPDAIEERFLMRHNALEFLANSTAHEAFNIHIENGDASVLDFTEDEINLMINFDRSGQRFSGHWDCPIPLSLMATSFQPYTPDPQPTGNAHI